MSFTKKAILTDHDLSVAICSLVIIGLGARLIGIECDVESLVLDVVGEYVAERAVELFFALCSQQLGEVERQILAADLHALHGVFEHFALVDWHDRRGVVACLRRCRSVHMH